MNEFVKKIIVLGVELDKTDSPIQISTILNDVEVEYRKLVEQIKNENIKIKPVKKVEENPHEYWFDDSEDFEY